MKNKFLKVFILFALLAVLIFACSKEYDNLFNKETIDIEEAQAWFENNKPTEFGLKSINFKGVKLNFMPDWKYAFSKNNKDFKTVEMPIKAQGRFGFATKESKEAYEQTKDDRYMNSQTRMVVLTEKKSNNTIGFLMTIIPDKEYRDKTTFGPYYSSYRNWQKGFSGYIFYHTLEGDFANGWKFSDGKVTKKVEQKAGKGFNSNLESPTCYAFYLESWYQNCTNWYTQYESGDVYTGTSCGVPYVEFQYLYTECEGGGGGASYSPQNNDPYQQSNTPNTDAIYRQSSTLSLSQKASLEIAIVSFKNKYPEFLSLLEKLEANGRTFKFKIDPNILGLAAFYLDGTIAFKSEEFINVNQLQEELIHAYQFDYYSYEFDNNIRNFEFEAKVFQDLVCVKNGMPCTGIVTYNLQADAVGNYLEWIYNSSQSGMINISQFNNFCNVWSYPNPPNNYCDPNFVPEILIEYFNH